VWTTEGVVEEAEAEFMVTLEAAGIIDMVSFESTMSSL
jgi:hypothetical protein